MTDLEEIHKKVLSSQDSATREATAVRRALTAVYQVTRVCDVYMRSVELILLTIAPPILILLYSGAATAW